METKIKAILEYFLLINRNVKTEVQSHIPGAREIVI